jgi:DNA-binding IclR family transcriptional regulator
MVRRMISTHDTSQAAYAAPIVTKATKILRLIIKSTNNLGLSEIASQLSLAKSTTHGILTALESAGWVLRDPISRAYTCGYAMKDLSEAAVVRVPLATTARPFLEDLSAKLGEDIFLGVVAGKNILILDQIETTKELKVTARPGTRLSLFAGAAGKIFLAYLDEKKLDEILQTTPLPRFTPASITDPREYKRDLERVRAAGIAVDLGEYISNCRAVAAPIFYGKKNRRRVVAGFWLVSLDWEHSSASLDTIKKLTLETSEAISRTISSNYA